MSAAQFVGIQYYVEPGQKVQDVASIARKRYFERTGKMAVAIYVKDPGALGDLTELNLVVYPCAYVLPGYIVVGNGSGK